MLSRGVGEVKGLAVRSVRATLRRELLAALPAAIGHENDEQIGLSRTRDAREGIRAAREGREPLFHGE
jgi:enoyl-CoA hydratase/carnithine racemase